MISKISLYNIEEFNFKDRTVWFLDFNILTKLGSDDNVNFSKKHGNIIKELPIRIGSALLDFIINKYNTTITLKDNSNTILWEDSLPYGSHSEKLEDSLEVDTVVKIFARKEDKLNGILKSLINTSLMMKELIK